MTEARGDLSLDEGLAFNVIDSSWLDPHHSCYISPQLQPRAPGFRKEDRLFKGNVFEALGGLHVPDHICFLCNF